MSDAPELVSVILPVWNGVKFVARAVASVLAQTYPHFELIIVDDGSTDGSRELLSAERDPRISLHWRNGTGDGPAAARNVGLKAAKGSFVGFIDQDDQWLPEKLARQLAALREHPRWAMCHTSLRVITHDEVSHPDLFKEHPQLPVMGGFAELFDCNFVMMPTPLLRKSVVDALGGFDERLYGTDDYHLWLRLTLEHELGFLPDVLAERHVHDDNASHRVARMTENEIQALSLVLEDPRAKKLVPWRRRFSHLRALRRRLRAERR